MSENEIKSLNKLNSQYIEKYTTTDNQESRTFNIHIFMVLLFTAIFYFFYYEPYLHTFQNRWFDFIVLIFSTIIALLYRLQAIYSELARDTYINIINYRNLGSLRYDGVQTKEYFSGEPFLITVGREALITLFVYALSIGTINYFFVYKDDSNYKELVFIKEADAQPINGGWDTVYISVENERISKVDSKYASRTYEDVIGAYYNYSYSENTFPVSPYSNTKRVDGQSGTSYDILSFGEYFPASTP